MYFFFFFLLGSNGQNEFLPLKKILLCAGKTILITFGDFETLEYLRIQYREEAGLERHFEHTLQVLRERVPAIKVPVPENQNNHAGDQKDMWDIGEAKPRRSILRPSLLKVQTITSNSYEDDYKPIESGPEPKKITTLPWRPKIDERELNLFLKYLRLKYFGLDLAPHDVDTLFGLPEPIQEGIKILKQNLYTPLSDVQLRNEERLNRYFMSAQDPIRPGSVETFYETAWRDLRQYVITLLKLMLAATPLSVEKDKYLNIDAEIDAKLTYGALNHMLAETIGSDIKRHKDIIIKTISSIILLLLKHYKLNHILQFEFLCSCLTSGNCLPFIVKYFNQNLDNLVLSTKTSNEGDLEYPQCVRTKSQSTDDNSNEGSQNNVQPCYTQTTSSTTSSPPVYSSCNITSCINLLRILNKLVKNKQSRIMALIYFKSFASLKSALRIRHNVLQFYALKLIKLQSRYQGRQWRKVNIKILGYVFLMVRHRFHDDWAYGNELENKQQLDSQADEAALKRIVLRFNKRRYTNETEAEFTPLDNTLSGALGKGREEELSPEFEQYWPQWLEQKVLASGFDWDQLLRSDAIM
ncbi:striatin-interacting protein 2 [Diaphorina citri]|uniref:Striatin-interacting protein 2 n=1 Tax=Diaphorina citri TaxID=121845 RepID=A0A3Q0IYK3_DIACI|nr:striatin-interacting protein 2 [Diaphorina citri]